MQLSQLVVIKETYYYPHFMMIKPRFSLSDLPNANQSQTQNSYPVLTCPFVFLL